MRRLALLAVWLLATACAAACSSSAGSAAGPGTPTGERTPSGGASASPALPGAQPVLPSQPARVGPVTLQVELATTPAEQEAGLRGRTLAPGRGMAFPYPGGRAVRFTMAGVTGALTAVFVSGGRVVAVEPMAPCPGTVEACPTYGPPTDVDLVVEGRPDELSVVRPGDAVALPAAP